MHRKEKLENNAGSFVLKSDRSAIVVGASLSGLMTGIALARAGFDVTIFEQSGPQPRSGAALQVDGGEMDRSELAKYLRALASGGIRSIEAWFSVQSCLRKQCENSHSIEIRYQTRVQSVHQDDNAAWIVTATGETVKADILIGADGYSSRVRGQVATDKPNATFAGYMIWVALVDEKDIPEKHRPSRSQTVSMPAGIGDFLLGSVIAGADGSSAWGQRRLGWAWYDNTQNEMLKRLGCVEGSIVSHSLYADQIPADTLIELTQKAAERWPEPWLDATLHSIETGNLTGLPISEYVPQKLVNGRIALAGDTAHVMTPLTAMGFNAALKDAATLADCVSEGVVGQQAAKALLAYESQRLKTVRQLVQSGQFFSRSFGR